MEHILSDERASSLYKTVFVFAAVLLSLILLFAIKEILILFTLAFLFGYALNSPVTWLQKKGVPRWITLILLLIILISIVAIAFSLLIPVVIEQVKSFANNAPVYEKKAIQYWYRVTSAYPEIKKEFDLGKLITQSQQRFSQAITPIFSAVSSLVTFFIGVIFVFVITIFGLTDPSGISNNLIQLIPPKHREKIVIVADRVTEKIGSYLRGVLIAGLVIGIASYIGFSIIGIEYAVTLAIIAGILEMVPLMGPLISGAIAVTVALFQMPLLAVYTLIFCTGLQQLENHVLIPKIMSRQVGLHPVTIIFTTLVMVKLLGVVGFFLAVPTASTIKILIEEIYLPSIGKSS